MCVMMLCDVIHVCNDGYMMSQTIEQFEDLLKNCSHSYKGEVPTVSDEEYQTLYDSSLVSD